MQLLDHLIRPLEQRWRDRQAEGLGGLEVDYQLQFGWLLNRDVSGLGTHQDLVNNACHQARPLDLILAVPDETTSLSE